MATDEVLIAVDAASPTCTADDRHLLAALTSAGFAARPVVWGADVPAGATVVVRSTWDYIERPREFAAWLDLLDDRAAIVHNTTDLMRWNMHKQYLVDLAAAGVPTVPTVLVPAGSAASLAELMGEHDWRQAVVKPAVGGTARLAATSTRLGVPALQQHLNRIVALEDALIQPYVETIETVGEHSVVALGGEVRLCVRKSPKRGEWRIQSDFGGTCAAVPLPADMAAVADQVLARLPVTPTYARIDLVRGAEGAPRVMECELVEPELFFRLDPTLPLAFVDVLRSSGRG